LEGRSFLLVDPEGGARLGQFFDLAAEQMGVAAPRTIPSWLFSALVGRALFETLCRDLEARPSELLASGFQFTYPTVCEGLAATLLALGYSTAGAGAPARRRTRLSRLSRLTQGLAAAAIDVFEPLRAGGARERRRGLMGRCGQAPELIGRRRCTTQPRAIRADETHRSPRAL
jgi:hypothetical protein